MSAAADHDLYQQSGGNAGKPLGYPPEVMEFPEEPFRILIWALLDAVLSFPQTVAFATEEVRFLADVADDDAVSEKSYENTVKLASEAVALATKLRAHYRLAHRKLNFGAYDQRKVIDEKVANQAPRVVTGEAE